MVLRIKPILRMQVYLYLDSSIRIATVNVSLGSSACPFIDLFDVALMAVISFGEKLLF
jgi:hypothetical protein